MQLPIFEKYIDELIEKSTLDVPAWNIEKAREGKAAGWNYIDGCMILALLEIYNATGEKKYYEFADAFIDHRVQEDGTITKYSVEEYNIDNVNAGKTLFALYALNGKEKYRKAIDLITARWRPSPAPRKATSGTRRSIPIRYGWTACTWDSPSTWSMRPNSMTRSTMMTFFISLPML